MGSWTRFTDRERHSVSSKLWCGPSTQNLGLGYSPNGLECCWLLYLVSSGRSGHPASSNYSQGRIGLLAGYKVTHPVYANVVVETEADSADATVVSDETPRDSRRRKVAGVPA
jgi:hypothetical protein